MNHLRSFYTAFHPCSASNTGLDFCSLDCARLIKPNIQLVQVDYLPGGILDAEGLEPGRA